jgi:hypothetical protein
MRRKLPAGLRNGGGSHIRKSKHSDGLLRGAIMRDGPGSLGDRRHVLTEVRFG